MIDNNQPTPLAQLQKKWQVQERPFQSDTPLIGPLIVWLRESWNSVSTKWYVRPLIQQQNEFNRLTVEQLKEIIELRMRLEEFNGRLIAQDKNQSTIVHDMGELTTQLIQTNHLLKSIDERLARLEKG